MVNVRHISIYTMFSFHSIQNKWHLLLGFSPSVWRCILCLLRISAAWTSITMYSFRDFKGSGERGRRETTTLLFFSQLSSAYLKYLIMIQQYYSNRIAGLKANATVTMSFIFLPVVFIHLLLGTKSLNPFPNT